MGGDNPIVVQSMTITDTRDVDATVAEALRLEEGGLRDGPRRRRRRRGCAFAGSHQVERINIPLIADIHFNYKHALTAIEQGVDKVRINPGNIGGEAKFIQVIERLRDAGMPARIGVNAGSLEMDLIERYGYPTSDATGRERDAPHRRLRREGYRDFCVSLKSSSVPMTIKAYRLFAEKVADVPLHLGVTEAGDPAYGAIKSAAGLGGLLVDGIGDTIRVSLLGDPCLEIPVAFDILKATGRRVTSPEIVACPSCGRIEIDLEKIVAEVKERLGYLEAPDRRLGPRMRRERPGRGARGRHRHRRGPRLRHALQEGRDGAQAQGRRDGRRARRGDPADGGRRDDRGAGLDQPRIASISARIAADLSTPRRLSSSLSISTPLVPRRIPAARTACRRRPSSP